MDRSLMKQNALLCQKVSFDTSASLAQLQVCDLVSAAVTLAVAVYAILISTVKCFALINLYICRKNIQVFQKL
jgi:hypothetical protein